MTTNEVMKKYKCVIAHLICQSLGYFTPGSAANAVLAHKNKEAYGCEWYCHIVSVRGRGMFDELELIKVNREQIERGYIYRHSHSGYMQEYKNARRLVNAEIERCGSTSDLLASWF